MNRSFYNRNGYWVLKQFFQKEKVEAIYKDAKNVFLRQFIEKGYCSSQKLEEINLSNFDEMMYRLFEEDFETLSNCGKQAQHLIKLHNLSLSKKILVLLKEVGLASPVISTRPVLFFNHPKLSKKKVYYKVDAHQDWRSMQGSLNSVVIWLPLVDINKELGALQILPESHLNGLRTDHINTGFGMVKLVQEEEEKLLTVEVERGDIILFSSFLIHQSGNNITNTPRWSCHFRYNDLDEPTFISRKFAHPYSYYPKSELITNRFPTVDLVQKVFED